MEQRLLWYLRSAPHAVSYVVGWVLWWFVWGGGMVLGGWRMEEYVFSGSA